MRLIDADVLDYQLGASDEDICFRYMLEDAPTIDAIPVEWLLKKKASCIHIAAGCIHTASRAYQTAWLIDDLIKEWRKEQDA